MKIDKAKVKKNAIDVAGLAMGVGLGVIVANMTRGKLGSKWLEPLVLFAPGVAGAILIDNDFGSSVSKGVAVAGAIDGAQKVTSIPALSFANKVVPKVSNGMAGLGAYDPMSANVLLGFSGGSRLGNEQIPAFML